jgi:hypothetical protein
VTVRALTDLAGQQAAARALMRAAFVARLGAVEVTFDFHRGWNGGWRCLAQVGGKAPLDFALLHTDAGALLALPVPFPRGWRTRGVVDSAGVAWTVNDEAVPIPV